MFQFPGCPPARLFGSSCGDCLSDSRVPPFGYPWTLQADKGLALEDLSARLGVLKEEILAIGDNENDLGMLRSSGITVAMGNSTDSVKKMAMILTDTNEEDGAAKVIEEILQSRKG